jgi:hypothetical protein
MGHDSVRAALIYQHASIDADRHIAASMGGAARAVWSESTDNDEGDAGDPGPLEPTG